MAKKRKKKQTSVSYATGRLLIGSCLERLKDVETGSVDSIVTDPPYELGFMGKAWDASGVAYQVELWRECLRVLKPGGHLLAFGGTRTYHRMAVAIEDAGFEIRDSIHWVYGSGFPKSLDVSKAIDKQRHDRADIYKVTQWIRETRDAAGITNRDIDDAFGFSGMAGHWTSSKSQPAVPTLDQVSTLLDVLGVKADDVPEEMRRLIWDLNGHAGEPGKNWAKREVTGQYEQASAGAIWRRNYGFKADLTPEERRDQPATDAAKRWSGWGTALKPAHEPIVLARKPLDGTVAANVLEHGTGALNIDGCRVSGEPWKAHHATGLGSVKFFSEGETPEIQKEPHALGRWPANIIFDEDAGAELGDVARFFYCPKPGKKERDVGLDKMNEQEIIQYQTGNGASGRPSSLSEGRDTKRRNFHPTVKPVELMRYLVRLITPPGGVVLDPFLGSGTTAVAAILEGHDWIGCEMTEDYLPIIKGRVQWAQRQPRQLPHG